MVSRLGYELWFRDVSTSTWYNEYFSDRSSLATADTLYLLEGGTVVADAYLDRRPA